MAGPVLSVSFPRQLLEVDGDLISIYRQGSHSERGSMFVWGGPITQKWSWDWKQGLSGRRHTLIMLVCVFRSPPGVRHVLGPGALPRTVITDGLGVGWGGG